MKDPRVERGRVAEDAAALDRTYVLYLQLYLAHFARLSPRERMALTMVEVDGMPYRGVAAALGIRPENLKMVVFRSRQKIHRGMQRQLQQAERDALAVRRNHEAAAPRGRCDLDASAS